MQSQPHQKQTNKLISKGLKYLINENLINISSLLNQVKQQAKKQITANDFNELNTKHKTTTNIRTALNNNMVRLNWPQTRRQLSLLFVTSFIMIIISVLSSSLNAEHALSEVWSESDGLQMKYSTDHEDLLSTKGSELQLNIHGKPNESGGSSEESAANSGGTTNNQEGVSSTSENESESNGTPTTSGSGGSDHASDGSSGQSNAIPTSTSNNDDTESSSVSSNDDSSDRGSSSSGEDSADSTSSHNRVPLSKQSHHLSSNSLSRQHQSSRFSEPSARFKTNSGQRDGSLTENDEEVRATRYKQSESDVFNSFGNENNNNNNNNNDQASSMSDQVNVDNGPGDDLPSAQASQEMLAGKAFRQVGRLFKEAVKMGGSDKAKSSNKSSKNSNKDKSNESEENDDENNNNNEQANNSEKQQQDDDAPSSASQEPDYNQFKNSANSQFKMAGSPRARQNMIDFDRVVDNKAMMMNQQQQTTLHQQQGELPDEISNVDGGGSGEEELGQISSDDYRRSLAAQNRVPQIGRQQVQQLMNSPPDEFGMFQPNNIQNSNPFFASGSSPEKKERVAPLSKQVNNKQHTTSNKPLAYFKGLSQQQKQASDEARRVPQTNNNRQQVTQQRPLESPDNVRDNFISPGHFPGSMPHLTHAASETQKKEAELHASNQQPVIAAAATTTTSTTSSAAITASSSSPASSDQSQATTLASSDPTISVASSTSVVSLTSPSNISAESSQQEQQQKPSDTKQSEIGSRTEPSSSAESRERDLLIHVTPVPEIQPESQQIMAPVYYSTTTMAPLPTTSAAPTSGGNKATTTTTTTTSSEPPTLKRFKFRKYRR